MNRFNSRSGVLTIALVAMGLSACATVRSTVDVADDADLGAYRTFAWVSDGPLLSTETANPELVNSLNERRIRSALEIELTSKGYTLAPRGEADLVLAYTLGARDRVRIQNRYNDFGYQYYGYYNGFSRFGPRFSRFGRFGTDFGYYRRGFSGFGLEPVQTVRTFTEGTLVLDVFDNRRNEAVWHCTATKRITRNDNGKELIPQAVDSLLEQFPDRRDLTKVMSEIGGSA